MLIAHTAKNGDYIPGEVKVAMTLRILAGASYLYMFLWFNVNPDYVREMTHKVRKHWFCNDAVMAIDFYKVMDDSQATNRIRQEFSVKKNYIMNSCIGALDGWLVYQWYILF